MVRCQRLSLPTSEIKGVLVGPKCNTMDTCIFAKDYVLLSTIVAIYVIEEIEALSAWKVKMKAILSNLKVMRIFYDILVANTCTTAPKLGS